MLDYSTIQDIKQHATNEAVRKGLKPCVIDNTLLNVLRNGGAKRPLIPFLGDHCPLDWKRVDDAEFFVDCSGFGSSNEPALTQSALADELTQYADGQHGIAVTEAGQFQVYCQVYIKA